MKVGSENRGLKRLDGMKRRKYEDLLLYGQEGIIGPRM